MDQSNPPDNDDIDILCIYGLEDLDQIIRESFLLFLQRQLEE